MPNTDIHPAFESHRLSPEGQDLVDGIKLAFSNLYRLIEQQLSVTRERSIAITELQTACLWAVRAATVDPANHYVDTVRSGSPE